MGGCSSSSVAGQVTTPALTEGGHEGDPRTPSSKGSFVVSERQQKRMQKRAQSAGLLSVDAEGPYRAAGGDVVHRYSGMPCDKLLMNPERGYRLCMLDFPKLESIDQIKKYNCTVVQCVMYLTDITEGDIPPSLISQMNIGFDKLRKHGAKALLRFGYERDAEKAKGPEFDVIFRHVKQVTQQCQKNIDVIYALQAGWVGAWGEWHNSTHGLENQPAELARLLATELFMLLPDRPVQVRVPRYKMDALKLSAPKLDVELTEEQWAFKELTPSLAHKNTGAARIGFHNDGFLANEDDGGTFPEPPYYSAPGNSNFDYMTNDSMYTPVDGELYWEDQGGRIEGHRAATRLRQHHYDTFGTVNGFSVLEGTGKEKHSIDYWLKTNIPKKLKKDDEKLCMSTAYNKKRQPTYYEYIRDHLGYRLELQTATFPKHMTSGGTFDFHAEFCNYGFSAPVHYRHVYIVLIDEHEEPPRIFEFPVENCDPRKWYPHAVGGDVLDGVTHSISVKKPQGVPKLKYSLKVGIWLPDPSPRLRMNAKFAIRLANEETDEFQWWTHMGDHYGINVVGRVYISEESSIPAQEESLVTSEV